MFYIFQQHQQHHADMHLTWRPGWHKTNWNWTMTRQNLWSQTEPSFLMFSPLLFMLALNLTVLQWSMLWYASQITNCNHNFCDNYFFICFLHWCVVLLLDQPWNSHGTAMEQPQFCSKLFWWKQYTWEGSKHQKQSSQKTALTIDYLAAR